MTALSRGALGLCLALLMLAATAVRAAEPAAPAGSGAPVVVEAPAVVAGEEARPAPRVVIPLDDAYRLALRTHEQVRIAQKEVEKARLLPLKALTLVTPRLSLQGLYTRYARVVGIGPTPGTTGPFGNPTDIFPIQMWQGNVQLVQPLFEPRVLTRWHAASSSISAAKDNLQVTAKDLLLRVANAYFGTLKAQSLVEVSRQTRDLANEELRVAKARFQVGEETKTAILRAEVDVARAERDLIMNSNNLELQLAVLANLINEPATFEVTNPEAIKRATEPLPVYQETALKERDDLKAAQENAHLSRYNRNLVREDLLPSANASFVYTRVTPQSLIQVDNFWTFQVTLNVPIFEGGLTYLNMAEASKNITQSDLQVGNLKKQIAIEVKDAFLRVRTLESTLATLEKQAQLAKENYDIVFKQYQVGVATSLDVTDALTALKSALTDLTNERYDYQVALLNLQKATGTFGSTFTAGLSPASARIRPDLF
jgi:outer membrane protein TolC